MVEVKFSRLLNDVLKGGYDIDTLSNYKSSFMEYSRYIMSKQPDNLSMRELNAFLRLCLNYYNGNSHGDILIPDAIYDQCMEIYKNVSGERIVFEDSLDKKWEITKHDIPGMVGSLDKIYSFKELSSYLSNLSGVKEIKLAPKFDGVSCSIQINGNDIKALTRYDGISGQDITQILYHAKVPEDIGLYNIKYGDGYYKCELCISTEDFDLLCAEKKYANRRSAVSAIVSTPSNLMYAKYITVIPILFYNGDGVVEYIAPYTQTHMYCDTQLLLDEMRQMLEKYRDYTFPFRIDGIVMYPILFTHHINELDMLDNAMAFKSNTSEGKTYVEYGYMSIGRMGKAVPMLKVKPVEVNETIVTDVSLGSYEKFLSMNMVENCPVIIFSAGDVIPQVKYVDMYVNMENQERLKIARICPYCNEKLSKNGAEYYCMNDACIRVITGRITNFAVKMGMEGFSDRSIEQIYQSLGTDTIIDFLALSVTDIQSVDGFESVSANKLYDEIQKIKNTPVSVSRLFGALGIEKISELKCRKIFEYITLDDILRNKSLDKLYFRLQAANGIGPATARTFIAFIKTNLALIAQLTNRLKIITDECFMDNVIFTGFRDPELQAKFRNLGIDVANTVTSNTILVLTSSLNSVSSKMKSAMKKGIPVYHYADADEVLRDIIKNRNHLS